MITARYKPAENRNNTKLKKEQYESMIKQLEEKEIVTEVRVDSENGIYFIDQPNPDGFTGCIVLQNPEYIHVEEGPIRVISGNKKNQLRLFSLLEGILKTSLEEIK